MAKTKLCSSCREEIDAKATRCPHCRASQPTGCLKPLLICFLSFFFFCIVLNMIITDQNKHQSNTKSENDNATSSSDAPKATKPQYQWVYKQKKDDFDGTESKFDDAPPLVLDMTKQQMGHRIQYSCILHPKS